MEDRKNPKVDAFIDKSKHWKPELTELRSIVLETNLVEDFKWYQPCYTYHGKNVLIVSNFKDSCIINFFKGVLLKDPDKILIQPGENSQASRFMKFTSVSEITAMKSTILAYIQEAIEVEKSGQKVTLKKTEDYEIPEELKAKFKANPDFEKAFKALTPGRQRGYLLYFSGAKQSKTISERIERYQAKIFEGKGFND